MFPLPAAVAPPGERIITLERAGNFAPAAASDAWRAQNFTRFELLDLE